MASFEGMDVEEDEENMSEQLDGPDLLWKGVVKPDEPLVASAVDKYFLRITNASFGPDVQKDTRTCLLVAQASDEESEAPGVVCTLKNTYENHKLDLLVSGDVQFQVSGKNPSPIHLIGHLSPAEQHVADNPFDMEDDEPTEDELENMDEQTKQELLKQLSRKRRFGEMEKENSGDEEGSPTAAQKKQKTASGKGKAAQNKNNSPAQGQDKNQNKNKNQKNNENNNKSNNQKSKKDDDTKEDDKPWKNGPSGLRYKDIRIGEGKPAKKGTKVSVYYVGQLSDKKVFDKTLSGPGFEFTLGAGDVIQGWELGVNGMKLGGKRKLIIPAKLGYGEEGSPPDIPANAELTFTVEVKSLE